MPETAVEPIPGHAGHGRDGLRRARPVSGEPSAMRRGICRCGRVAFEMENEQGDAARPASPAGAPPTGAHPLWQVPRHRLRVRAPEPPVGAYTFNGGLIGHRFCGSCGMHLFGEEIDAAGPPLAYVNPDCLETVPATQASTQPRSPSSLLR